MYNGSVLKVLPPELLPVDRIMLRWSVSVGDGIRRDEWDEKRKSLPPPLSDDLAIVVDQTILHSPPRTRDLLGKWYKSPEPTYLIAEEMKVSPKVLVVAWKLSLNFMRWKFETTKNPSLLKLLRVRL